MIGRVTGIRVRAMNKNAQRRRRAVKSRAKIRELKVLRLSVHRTPQHIYAQIFDTESKVLAAASTLQKDVREGLKGTGNADRRCCGRQGDRREGEGCRHQAGRVRSLRLQVSRPHQSAGRRGARERVGVLRGRTPWPELTKNRSDRRVHREARGGQSRRESRQGRSSVRLHRADRRRRRPRQGRLRVRQGA